MSVLMSGINGIKVGTVIAQTLDPVTMSLMSSSVSLLISTCRKTVWFPLPAMG